MKSRLADAAVQRLAQTIVDEPAMTEAEVLRVLASIARRGKPSDRLRAAELIGRQLGMFREESREGKGLTLEQLVPRRIPRPPAHKAEAEILDKREDA